MLYQIDHYLEMSNPQEELLAMQVALFEGKRGTGMNGEKKK
jgi:hypothetical protein